MSPDKNKTGTGLVGLGLGMPALEPRPELKGLGIEGLDSGHLEVPGAISLDEVNRIFNGIFEEKEEAKKKETKLNPTDNNSFELKITITNDVGDGDDDSQNWSAGWGRKVMVRERGIDSAPHLSI